MDAVFKAVFGNEMPAVTFIINAFGIYFKLFFIAESSSRLRQYFCESARILSKAFSLFIPYLTKEPLLTKNTYSSMSAWHIPKKMPSPLFCKSFAGSSCGIPGRLNLFLQMNKTGCCEHYAPAARRFAFRARLHNSLWN